MLCFYFTFNIEAPFVSLLPNTITKFMSGMLGCFNVCLSKVLYNVNVGSFKKTSNTNMYSTLHMYFCKA